MRTPSRGHELATAGASVALVTIFVMVLAGCAVTEPQLHQLSPDVAATISIRPAPGVAPTKPEMELAIEVLRRRLGTLEVKNYSIAAGTEITVSIGAQEDVFNTQQALQANGLVAFVRGAGTGPEPEIGTALTSPESLWPSAAVLSASVATDTAGAQTLWMFLTPAGTEALAAWSTAHVGERLIVTLDGRVLSAPLITVPITVGNFALPMAPGKAILPLKVIAAIIAGGPLPAGWRQP